MLLQDASLVSLLLLALSSLSLACIPCPVFTESSYTGSILENATIGAIVLTVTASNAYGDPITYSGLSYPFSIDASTGIIKLIGSLDSVSSPYAGTVVANVMGFTQSVSVAVNIIQLPDYPVTCSPSNLPLLVEENLDPPFNTTEFLNCTSDSTEPFVLVSDSSLVSFDPLGYIIIEEKLNYENKSVFDLLVSFTDSTMSALPGNASISLRVIPVNEYPPTFVNDTFFYTIPESTEIGSTVGILSAVDEDNGLDGQFVFTVQGGNGSDYVILTSSGQLYTIGHFDYDTTPPLYELIVIVSDTPWNRSSSLTSTATVIIEIEDVNDNPPIFSRFVYYTQIMENASLHEHILTVECHDIDSGINAIPVYSVTKQSHDHFYINASTGDIFLQSSLDYEMNTIHQVTVSCTDSQKSAYSSESLVVIQVLSVNEYQCTFNQSQYMFQVPEDASIGAIIGYVNATDEDKGTAGELTFEISPSSCSDIITVDDSSSAVILISEVDYEESSYIACSVSVYDKQAPITSNKANITLQILNINDNPPVCEPVLPINIYSNITTGTTIGNLTCTDKDLNDLSFFLMESVLQDSITIVSNGEVVLVHPINYDINITSVWITAIVTDGYHYDDIKMLLFIFPSLPVSNPGTYHASISEDASIGMIVTQVHCTSTLNDTVIHYTLSSNGKFQINVETGVIITISNLDYETAVLHQLTGACYYSNNPILYTELSLFITILPVNDNSPYFSETNVTIKVEEDAQPGSLLGALVAHDLDHGDDGRLKYFIDNSTKHFAINANTGDLYLINILDREREDQYSLLITVTDSPGNISETKSDSMTIRVQVQDINDNHPQCSHNRYKTSISTSTRVGTPLISLDCHDVDSMENGTLSFLIHENVSLFLLDSSSGELFLSEPITPATSPFHTIPILIKDHGVESQETLVYAVIELENTVTVAASPSDEEITVEGIRNAVTFTIDNIRETEWNDELQEILKSALANSTTAHCNLHPQSCSLLSMCINETSTQWTVECTEYLIIAPENIIILNRSPLGNSSSLQVTLYVLLPATAVKAPFRDTDYVVPAATLETIVHKNKKTIGALIRNSIHEESLSKEVWKPVALTFLSIIAAALSLAVLIACFQRKNAYKKGRKLNVVLSNDIVHEIQKPAIDNKDSRADTPGEGDGVSFINVSENGETRTASERSSCNGETGNSYILTTLKTRPVEFYHPFANNDTESNIT